MTPSNSLLFFLIAIYTCTHKAIDVSILSIARLNPDPRIAFFTNMTNSLVEITLIGPADKWFGIGIGNASMDNTYAFIVYDDGTVTERRLGYHNQGDQLQTEITDLTVISNTAENGIREILMTRSRVGYSTPLWYTFPNGRKPNVPLISAWATRPGDEFGWSHGKSNRIIATTSFSLSNETASDPTSAPT
eukprot:890709_1